MSCETELRQLNYAKAEYDKYRTLASEEPTPENAKRLAEAYENLLTAEDSLSRCTGDPSISSATD
jgi:hypothetical protein